MRSRQFEMDLPPASEVFHRTILPLIITYSPAILTVIVAWITLSQFYFKSSDKQVSTEPGVAGVDESKRSKAGKGNARRDKKKEEKHGTVHHHGHGTRKGDGTAAFSHRWLLTSLKGHSSTILDMDFSPNGKYLATTSNDRAVFIWSTKDWKDRDHKFMRYNVDYDHASLVKWSPDSKALVYNRVTDNTIEVCKLAKKPDGWIASLSKVLTFTKIESPGMVGLGIDVNGRYIMTASSGTDVFLWDLKGALLTKIDSYLMNNYAAKVSPCGNFIAASGFAPDVKVWEVSFTKSGDFKGVQRAFELSGHTSGVLDLDFSSDSSRMTSLSKDGSWRLYNTKIEYRKGEEAHLLKRGDYQYNSSYKSCIALSPSGDVIALSASNGLSVINASTGLVDILISNVYPQGQIQKVLFDAAGDYILTGGEKHVRIFHNLTGYKARIEAAKAKLNQSGLSQATKERLEQTIQTSEAFLANFS